MLGSFARCFAKVAALFALRWSRSRFTRSISAAREVEGARGGVLGQGFCVLRGSFARCFAEVAALFALSGEAGAVNMRGVKRFSMRVR